MTLLGDRFSSRYGASLVKAAGYPELIARDWQQYVAIASSLTPEWLAIQRQAMRYKFTNFGLGNSKQMAKNLEAAYGAMLGRA